MAAQPRVHGSSWADEVELEEVMEDEEEDSADGSWDEDEEEEVEDDGEEEEESAERSDDGSGDNVEGDSEVNGGNVSQDDGTDVKSSHSDPCSKSNKKRIKLRSYGSNDLDKELLEEDIWETQSLETCSAGVCVNASLKFSDQIQLDQSSDQDATDEESIGTDHGVTHGAMVEEEGGHGCCPSAVFNSAEQPAMSSAVHSHTGTSKLLLATSGVFPQNLRMIGGLHWRRQVMDPLLTALHLLLIQICLQF